MAEVQQQEVEEQHPAAVTDERDVAFYAAALDAFYTTSLEYDKGLFTLAAGGLGLLVTLLTTAGLTSVAELVAYLIGIAAFAVALFLKLWTFQLNKVHIIHVVQGTDQLSNEKLKKVDSAAMGAFAVGVVCAAVVGVLAAIDSFDKVKQMADKKPTSPIVRSDSVNGIKKVRPEVLEESYANAGKLRPRASSDAAASAPQNVQMVVPTTKPSGSASGTPAAPTTNPASNSIGKGK
ncbi:hypothetical protein [Burkholderia pseudomallei]|uniref:hypothetical protein n=1 Tax=Burkholderia pseudomallei TaxID=28450 RepID=UPI0005DCABEA|nr:hypothetical protein [Burkholderia pseudomallei]CAJ3336335.1 Uncharacterised protein [Burkholderia pseudomallei]CAJ3926675.1 Uncharacterised protein [Burkholderia pseudomallei]CAJ3978067.1 Uncharacterised protein [Burkholderia pseudomallei]CAJ5702912.1 Uncharacterised protein [Burkholderia pseudomallei]CAJ7177544.1 Uncharacterised protein [Burkholderia pseudomallei]